MKKISLKFRKGDIFVLGFSVLFVVSLLIAMFTLRSKTSGANVVKVSYNNQVVHTMNLDHDETFTMTKENFPLLLGDLVVVVKDHKVRVAEQTSKHNYCEYMGAQDKAGTAIVCAPNGVVITIEGYEPSDIDWGS